MLNKKSYDIYKGTLKIIKFESLLPMMRKSWRYSKINVLRTYI